MVKESRNFRLETETLDMLRQLAERWNVSQAQAVDILIREAIRENRELRTVREEK